MASTNQSWYTVAFDFSKSGSNIFVCANVTIGQQNKINSSNFIVDSLLFGCNQLVNFPLHGRKSEQEIARGESRCKSRWRGRGKEVEEFRSLGPVGRQSQAGIAKEHELHPLEEDAGRIPVSIRL